MNKLEKKYAENLELKKMAGAIVDWRFEPMRLRLTPIPLVGEKNPFYKPDFLVIKPVIKKTYFGGFQDGIKIEFHETKGHWREAALIRIKMAASLYPWFKFIAVTWERGGWRFREFKTDPTGPVASQASEIRYPEEVKQNHWERTTTRFEKGV